MSHLLETLEKAIKQEACKRGLFERVLHPTLKSTLACTRIQAPALWRELRFCNEIVIFYFNGYDILQQQQPYLSSHHHTQQDGLAGWAAALHWGDKWQEKGLIKQV